MNAVVYKIFLGAEWQQVLETQRIAISELDRRSGFVHLSSADQLLETCARYFRVEDKPIAIEIRTEDVEERLRWERVITRNNQAFPHLYGELHLSELSAIQELDYRDGEWYLGKRRTVLFGEHD